MKEIPNNVIQFPTFERVKQVINEKIDKNNICNACQWSFEKKTINWDERIQKLNDL